MDAVLNLIGAQCAIHAGIGDAGRGECLFDGVLLGVQVAPDHQLVIHGGPESFDQLDHCGNAGGEAVALLARGVLQGHGDPANQRALSVPVE